ncbi:hypothetical protein OESDEN_14536, partial [Oesophagostomum dentatum]
LARQGLEISGILFARTGYLGFLRQTQSITEDGELHDAVFVVGALEETLMLRGMRYHPVDIESTVSRCHKYLGDCAVFTWSHLIVVVAECTGSENDALDLVPAVTSSVEIPPYCSHKLTKSCHGYCSIGVMWRTMLPSAILID